MRAIETPAPVWRSARAPSRATRAGDSSLACQDPSRVPRLHLRFSCRRACVMVPSTARSVWLCRLGRSSPPTRVPQRSSAAVWSGTSAASPQAPGQQQVSFQAPNSPSGTLLHTSANLYNSGTSYARAVRISKLESAPLSAPLLAVSMSATPDPVSPGQTTLYQVTASNIGGTASGAFHVFMPIPRLQYRHLHQCRSRSVVNRRRATGSAARGGSAITAKSLACHDSLDAADCPRRGPQEPGASMLQVRSKRSAFITFVQAATKCRWKSELLQRATFVPDLQHADMGLLRAGAPPARAPIPRLPQTR